MALNANDGLARAINPIHTLADGDTVFAVSTGSGAPMVVHRGADFKALTGVFNAAADTLTRAVTKAILTAESHGEVRSYCDTYPSACAGAPQLQDWRQQGAAETVTPQALARASKALALTPVPAPN